MQIIRIKKGFTHIEKENFKYWKNLVSICFNKNIFSKKISNIVYFSGKDVVSTDGNRLYIFNNSPAGLTKDKNYEVLSVNSKEILLHEIKNEFPDYAQVIPEDNKLKYVCSIRLGGKNHTQNSQVIYKINTLTNKAVNFNFIKDCMDDEYEILHVENEAETPLVLKSNTMKYVFMPIISYEQN